MAEIFGEAERFGQGRFFDAPPKAVAKPSLTKAIRLAMLAAKR